MSIWKNTGLLSLCFFLFQNCGTFAARDSLVGYSYKTAPIFFYDMKLVSVESDSAKRELYIFDLAISYSHNPDQDVSYRVAFSTLDIPGVCRAIDGTASGAEKHARVQCLIPTEDDLFVQLTMVGPSGEEVTEDYRF